jgi:ATP-dependent helicase/nuclease subunit B
VLLATKRQEDAFRQRLVDWNPARHVYFNVEFFNFYDLYAHILDEAGQSSRELDDAGRFGLLRTVLNDLKAQGDLPYFGGIVHTPGFIRVVAEFIYELKQNRVDPDAFNAAASAPKDRELARVYSTYQERLKTNDLVDREGQGWLALAVLEKQTELAKNVAFLLVDGYDQFTPVQAELLTLLAACARDTLITLTTVPEREDTAGRRFKQAYERLEKHHQDAGQAFVVDAPNQWLDHRHPDLQRLVEQIFRLRATPAPPPGDAMRLLEAPDPAQEVAAVLRRVKRLLLTTDTHPDDILIALRDWTRYQAHFTTCGRAYGLSLALHYGEPLIENPAILALLNLLELHTLDFRRRELLDALRSPYFETPGIGSAEVDLLERISRQFIVTGLRDHWLEAVRRASHPTRTEDEPLPALLTTVQSQTLQQRLTEFFDAVTPPPRAAVTDYVRWIERLIGPDAAPELDEDEGETDAGNDHGLRLLWQVRQPAADGVIERDLAALHELKRTLRGLIAAQSLLEELGIGGELDWGTFRADLRGAVESASVTRRPSRTGRILVTTAADARGLPHDHVFILGLSEGLFPARLPEDPLYLDNERLAFRDKGVYLQTQAERAADESIFYELISLPRRSLTLSRPTVQEGKKWLKSHLWEAVERVFEDIPVERIAVGAVVAASDVASLDEAAIAVADDMNRPLEQVASGGLYGWLQAHHAAYWGHIHAGRGIEMSRLSAFTRFDHYSGHLRDGALLTEISRRLGPQHVWSASQLNAFGACGFQFFAKYLLKLESLEEPEEGLDAQQLGTLNHAILERAYRGVAERGLTISPENQPAALAILREAAAAEFHAAPERLGFRASAVWRQEQTIILRRLEALVTLDFSEDSPIRKQFGALPRHPYAFEAPFGAEVESPLWLLLDDGGSILVRGYIDRVDRLDDALVVVDYKAGAMPSSDDLAQGRNFQMMIYLEALEELLRRHSGVDSPTQIAGGLFWSINQQKSSRALTPDSPEIAQGREHLARYVALARRGEFAVLSNTSEKGKCARYCEFHQLCRMSSTSRRKPQS